jgi:hypothetical protein
MIRFELKIPPLAYFSITFSMLILFIATPGVASTETLTVMPSGVVTWDELLNYEKAAAATAAPSMIEQKVTPFMPAPDQIEIGLPGGPLQSESVPIQTGDMQPLAPSVITNFQALEDNNTSIPPDTMGAAGPSHLMTMLNTQVRIQDKTGSNLSTVSLTTFWTSGTGLSGNPFDPKIVYDSISGRWIATCDANSRSASSRVFFAISSTNDPTGAWTYYWFVADATGTAWADYPGFGVNQTWIAITNNMYTVSENSFSGAKMWVIDKTTALTGGALTATAFSTGFDNGGGYTGFTLKPSVTFGSESKLYITDNPGYSYFGTKLLRMSEITGTGSSPSRSVTPGSPFAGTGFFLVSNNFDWSQIDASQLGTSSLVNTNDYRILNAVFRNGRIWTTHSGGLPVGSVDRTAVFWYQLDPALMASTGAPIVQSGALDGGAGVHHFFPSISANKNDDACVGFSRSDSARYVEAVATCRSSGDSAGTMDSITVVKAGEDSYVKDFGKGRIRWGDYSGTVVDPVDDTTFWTIQEYAETDVGSSSSDDRWGTWWGKFATSTVINVCGAVSGTWTSGNTYNVTCDIIVNSGQSLTIESGTVINNLENYSLTVNGALTWIP